MQYLESLANGRIDDNLINLSYLVAILEDCHFVLLTFADRIEPQIDRQQLLAMAQKLLQHLNILNPILLDIKDKQSLQLQSHFLDNILLRNQNIQLCPSSKGQRSQLIITDIQHLQILRAVNEILDFIIANILH